MEGRVMPQFSPDQVTFQDLSGYGYWDDSHHREHQQFVEALAAITPPILIPNVDLLSFLTAGPARSSMVNSHMYAHNLLRQATGVGGSDYSQYNFDSSDDFYSFLGYHATEHAQIRQALGIV
jgi:hypothetical protein